MHQQGIHLVKSRYAKIRGGKNFCGAMMFLWWLSVQGHALLVCEGFHVDSKLLEVQTMAPNLYGSSVKLQVVEIVYFAKK